MSHHLQRDFEYAPAETKLTERLDYVATRIALKFGVSAEVIAKRLRVEKLWPPN